MRSVLRMLRRTPAIMRSATVKSAQAIHSRSWETALDVAESAAGELGHLLVELVCRLAAVEYPDHVDAHQGRLDGADRGEAPLDDACAALDVARDQLAGLLRQARGRARAAHRALPL